MKLKCELDGHSCILPEFIAQFILNAKLMYCGSIDAKNNPHIQPIIFTNEFGKCNLVFLVEKQSTLAKNLQMHPRVTLTTDKTHRTDPSWIHPGIMIEAISQPVISQEEIRACFENLQTKYGFDQVTKILGIDIILSYIKFEAFPTKIIFWKGPFFKRFICKQSKRRFKLIKKKSVSLIRSK
ncbi:MAG: pyridoxamine 5'-phosphate oxidase family protein [Candidatus Hodarchaeales archaeon]|jgi:general stress protein 26